MDLNYETKFEYIRLAPGINVIPRIPAIKNFTIRLFEMSEIQLLTFEDLKQLAIVLAKTCQEWYPKGIPFVLWAQLIAYSHVPVLSPPHDYSLGLNNIVYDSTQQCALTAFEMQRKKYESFSNIEAYALSKINAKGQPIMDAILAVWDEGILGIILVYAMRRSFAQFLKISK